MDSFIGSYIHFRIMIELIGLSLFVLMMLSVGFMYLYMKYCIRKDNKRRKK
jgi:uncharacterized membrane protein